MSSSDIEALKSLCPMPVLLERMGLAEFARKSCRSPFRDEKNPSWGIFEIGGKWFFKDQATGDTGDEVTLIARWRTLDVKRDFQKIISIYRELAAGPGLNGHFQKPPNSAPRSETKPFVWSTYADAYTPAQAGRLGQWRGYSPEFCAWLRESKVIGIFDNNWALPVHDRAGEVVACHYRVEKGDGEKPAWFYSPKGGIGTRALVFGDTKHSAHYFVFESPWDAFAVMDKLGWHHPKSIPNTAIIITRGSGNGRLAGELLTTGSTVYIFKQNDQTKDGKNAANDWLACVMAHSTNCEILLVLTPAQFKDPNDWTRAGATASEIMDAITSAKLVKPSDVCECPIETLPDNRKPMPVDHWPTLGSSALHGVAGELVKRLDPHTESDRAAILFQELVGFGNLIGRTAHYSVEAHKHFTNMNTVLVGNTSKGRKGTSWGHVRKLLMAIDLSWKQPASGLSTGEGLIWAVRDPVKKTDKNGEEEVVDEGEIDKRLLVVEEEFSRPLKCANRENNTLSAVFRQAFDTGSLRIITKTNPAIATEAHISCIGHITKQELSRHLTETECANGFANRILWVCVRRSKELPDGGTAHLEDFSAIEASFKKAVAFAQTSGELRRNSEAREFWRAIYHDLSEAKPGLFGAVTSRAEAYVVRLSIIYAVLDCSEYIRREHLEAALSAWRYCEDSARYIFGDSLGDADADALLATLRKAGPSGLTRTQITDEVFQRHKTKAEIDHAINVLAECGLAERRSDPTEGRPTERWIAR